MVKNLRATPKDPNATRKNERAAQENPQVAQPIAGIALKSEDLSEIALATPRR